MSNQYNSKQGGWCQTNKPASTTGPNITSTTSIGSYTYPTPGTWTSGYVTIANKTTAHPSYVLFKLPVQKLPDMVFLNGRALSLGLLGSKAECAFGSNSLIFAGQVFSELPYSRIGQPGRFTIILQYKTKTFHYCADIDLGTSFIALKPGTNFILAEPLCEIKRG